jgi:hypothetical protein
MYTAADHAPIRRRLLSALQTATSAPVRAYPVKHGPTHPLDVGVKIASFEFRVRWVGRCGTAKVREVLATQPKPEIIVGTEISRGAREQALSAGLGWVDETGGAELHFVRAGVLIEVSRLGLDRPRSRPSPQWTMAVLGAAEALLTQPDERVTVSRVRELTGYSVEATTRALRFLEDRGHLESTARRGPQSARRFVDLDRLLEEYADAATEKRKPLSLSCGVSWNEPFGALRAIGERWDKKGIEYAVSGAMAAQVLAPFATNVTSGEVYVDAVSLTELDSVAAAAKVKPIEGGRLVLRPFPTKATNKLSIQRDGLWIAPWPRVYADVVYVGVRGEEIGEHLKEVELTHA